MSDMHDDPTWHEALVDCGPCTIGHPGTFCLCEHGHECLWCLLGERAATIAAVRALHIPHGWAGLGKVCHGCGGDRPWPCPTVAALDAAGAPTGEPAA